MYKTIDFELVGVAPTIIHSGQMANPLNPLSKAMKEVTSKRKKTDQDIELMADLEWLASFYHNEPGEFEVKNNRLEFTGYGVPNWPGENFDSMLIAAAKEQRLGKQFKAAVMVNEEVPIDFGEKKTIEQIFRDPRYRDTRRVKVQTASVMRTRPVFNSWKMRVRVSYLESIVNATQVRQVMQIAGERVGISDYRPKYGRFEVK